MNTATKRYLEQELFCYKDTDKRIKQIREEIENPWKPTDENIGGGKGNQNASVTEQTATMLVTDKRLERLNEVHFAITKLYNESTQTEKDLIDNFYFVKPRTLTMAGVAAKIHVSERKLYKMKKQILKRLADELGMF